MGKQSRVITRQQRLARAAAQRRQAKRNRLLGYGGGLVIIGLLVAIVVAVANAIGGRSPVGGDAPKTSVAPANATAAGAIAVGNPAAPVKVEIYLDYMCPFCGRFERANAEQLDRLVADGALRLEVYPMSFLDKASAGTRYSTRAANAIATVADRAPDKVLAFNQALFAQQPQEGSEGLTDARIAELARGAAVPQDVIDAFAAGTYQPWIAKLTDTAFANGVNSTPTVKINGVVFKGDLFTAGPLAEAIAAAKGQP